MKKAKLNKAARELYRLHRKDAQDKRRASKARISYSHTTPIRGKRVFVLSGVNSKKEG